MIADLDVSRTDGPMPQCGIDTYPLALDPDFRPHVEAHFGPLTTAIDVDQAESRAGGNASSPAHRCGQHRMLPAISVQVLGNLGCRAQGHAAIAAHFGVDPALDGLCLLPRISFAADGFIRTFLDL